METLNQVEEKKIAKYVFPDFLAKAMAKVDIRTQYESSMLSMLFMMVGLILSVIYTLFYLDLAIWFKVVMIVNGFFGILFMWSYVITTYQQYINYMDVVKLQEVLNVQNKYIG